jgi:small subunit ribosomal protein S1
MTDQEEKGMTFAELFASSPETPGRRFSAGEAVSGTVVKISGDTVFIDLGGKSEGMADLAEFRDGEGNVTVKEGQTLELRVASTRDGIHLTKGIKVQGAEALEILRDAQRNQVPVEGRVAAVNKGGFEVDLAGVRAFCPVSQIELQYCDHPEKHVNQRYSFRIMEIRERGRDVLVSRRALLQEEQEKKLQEIMAVLKPGAELEGKVTRLTGFGAFVDLGGIEGMVHVSEIAHARIGQPSEVLTEGQVVRVRVLRVETDAKGRPRIGLSIKALEPDAWDKGFSFSNGDIIRGKVSRLADFGAFIEVAPGVDGLVHLSELSFERVSHPNKVLREGDDVEVLILQIDPASRRISLSLKEAAVRKMGGGEAGSGPGGLAPGRVVKGIVENIKPYGLFVRLPQGGLGVRGLLPLEEMKEADKGDLKKRFPKGQEITVEVLSIDEAGKIRLSQRSMEDRVDREGYNQYQKNEEKSGFGTLGDLFKDIKLP